MIIEGIKISPELTDKQWVEGATAMKYSKLFNTKAEIGSDVLEVAGKDAAQDRASKTHYELSRVGNAGDAGLQQLNNAPEDARYSNSGDNKKKKPKRSFLDIIQEYQNSMNEMMQRMKDMAKQFREQVSLERDIIFKETERMQENSRFVGKAERWLEDYKKGKKVDKSGVLSELRKRGVNVSDDMPLAVLMEQHVPQEMDKANQDNAKLDEDIHQREYKVADYECAANDLETQCLDLAQDFEDLRLRRANGLSADQYELQAQQILNKYENDVVNKYQSEYPELGQQVDEARIEARVEKTPDSIVTQENSSDIDDLFSDVSDNTMTASAQTKSPFTPGG